ncbi:1716_t:CDS:2, partial [Racocetra fulgida]
DKLIHDYFSQILPDISRLRMEGDQNKIFLEIFLPEIDLIVGENKERIKEIVHEVKSLLGNEKITLRINLREVKNVYTDAQAIANLTASQGKLVLKLPFTKENFDEKSNGQLLIKRFNFNIMVVERTLAIVKPDITQRNLVGEVISIWEKKGLRVIEMKMTRLSQHQATIFYAEHREKDFFAEMVNFMCSAPVVIVCLEGENAIRLNREIMGETNPAWAQKDTIRKIFGTSITANAVHGSDSLQAAQREINFFFSE